MREKESDKYDEDAVESLQKTVFALSKINMMESILNTKHLEEQSKLIDEAIQILQGLQKTMMGIIERLSWVTTLFFV